MTRAVAKPSTAPRAGRRDKTAPVPSEPQSKEDRAIYRAVGILEKRMRKRITPLSDPVVTQYFLRLWFAGKEVEHFVGLFLNSQLHLIAVETLSIGTIDAATVYAREVVKRALALNAAAVIFAHNHPSGDAEPSTADRLLTDRLKQALALVDVRVLDHFVVGDGLPVSLAERGWL